MPTRSFFQDSCRQGEGLILNGRNLAVRGVCACGGRMFVASEMRNGKCVDCDADAQRYEAEGAQRACDEASEPVWSTL